MKVCKRCSSPDVAQSVWWHCNSPGMMPMPPEVTFYWCFNCNLDTEVVEKEKLLPSVTVTTNVNLEPTEVRLVPVQAHVREQPINHEPKQLTYHTDTWEHGERRVRYWMLVKNAKRYKHQEDVVWESQNGNKVQVWKTLKPTTFKRRKK